MSGTAAGGPYESGADFRLGRSGPAAVAGQEAREHSTQQAEPVASAAGTEPRAGSTPEAADGQAEVAAAHDPRGEQAETDSESAGTGGEQPDPVAMANKDALPDLSSDEALMAALEALLLVVDAPVSEQTLAAAVEQPVDRVTEALRTMANDLQDRRSGIDLRRVGEGWRMYTRDIYAPYVEKLLLDGQRSKLTRAALETLAVIAYRQPVTRARVAAVRGVNVDGVIRTLLARGLIAEAGTDPETGGTLYETTELFLERLGLSSLDDLPPIAPLLPEVDSIDDLDRL
ncbi:MAG: SMC-Scp complex subunit ScpB [Thermocrispum agreste]|uniref:SMC-Scp complex subunit ScpB n=1 Tax=Thermocrispum agreste TaxID=37925 RepID=A0ABD6FFM8_9PSEU|nr:SMC-Scp complex subunit ScpB [Thermocrispum agreste]